MNYVIGIVNLVSSQKYFNMRNFYSKLFFLLLPALATSQLYVGTASDSSFVYNMNEIVYVHQNIQLTGATNKTEGNIYLRGDGQLIQGDNSSENSGTGSLSAIQVNTQNRWDYHFWASPVSDTVSTNTSIYSGTNEGNSQFYHTGDNGGGLFQPSNYSSKPNTIVSNPITFISGYDGRVGAGNAIEIAEYWLYKYIAKSGYSGWQQLKGNALNPGEGYAMKGVGTSTSPGFYPIDFRGKPNNGTINVKVIPDNQTLVGNPYPSAMNLSYYLLSNSGADETTLNNCVARDTGTRSAVNTTITGEAFFWQSNPNVQSHYLVDYEGGYGTFTPVACNSTGAYSPATFVRYDNDGNEIAGSETGAKGDSIPRHIAPIGQGFFVQGAENLDSSQDHYVTALNDFRVFVAESADNYSVFKSNTNKGKDQGSATKNLVAGGQVFDDKGYVTLPEFKVETFINNTYNRVLTGVMFDSATLNKDKAMDGSNISEIATDVSFKLPDTDKPIITNVFPYDIEVKLPLKISGNNATNTYRMIISSLNFTPDESIYLHDKQTDEYHDILNQSYEFELEKGTYTDRFEIVFKDEKTLDVEEVEEVKRSFNIYQNNGRAELTVLNPLQTELKEITVFDISGRLLVSKINEGTNEKVVIPSSAWSDGVYIVRVTTKDNIEYSKKVSVRNRK